MGRCAFSAWAHKAGCMSIIDHDEGVEFICQCTNFIKLGDIAIHRENAVGDDQLGAGIVFICLLKLFSQLCHIGIGKAVAFSFAQAHTINN